MRISRSLLFVSALLIAGCVTAMAEGTETIYSKVDENPIPIKTPPPHYPDTLKREGISGIVAVIVVIDEKGNIASSVIGKSSHPEFEKPALDAVKSWKFKPAKKDGSAVKVRVTVPLRFNVEDSS